MLVYVAGPYSKTSDMSVEDNINVSANIAGELWDKGHAVICPHMNTGLPWLVDQGNIHVGYEDFMRGDFRMICHCDALVMVPGWENSKGAVREQEYAMYLGIPIYIYPDIPNLHPTEVKNPEQVTEFRELLGRMYRVHLDKNQDYSAANVLVTGWTGLATRLWDKVARYANLSGRTVEVTSEDELIPILFDRIRFILWTAGISTSMKLSEFTGKKTAKNESVDDSLMDMAVYALIGLLLRRKKWGR